MYGSIITILLLIVGVCLTQDVLTCRDEEDYYNLLYKICTQSTPCKHLFHLYPLESSDVLRLSETPERDQFVDHRNRQDFQLFRHQLAAQPIFHLTTSLSDRLVLQNTVPDAWLPKTTVLFEASVATTCTETTQSDLFVVSALYGMQIYKMTVADQFYCHDPNERFLLDPLTNVSYCVCKTDKSCNNDSNFDSLFLFLLVILIVGIFAASISIFAGMFYKKAMLHDLSRSSSI